MFSVRSVQCPAHSWVWQQADLIRQAALLRAQKVERRLSLSILPVDGFDAFSTAVDAPGKVVPGLTRAAEMSKGILTDAG